MSGSCSKVLDSLKSRYSCLYEPGHASTNAKLDADRRYLPSLTVYGNREVEEDHAPAPHSLLPNSFSNLMVEQNIIDPHIIREKITSALKVLKFRDKRVLVQFWSPVAIRKRWLLTTWDQPFGLGVATKELYSYRWKSEQRAIILEGADQENLGPPGRVYIKKLPEWSLDVHGGNNRYGYIDLPVFDSSDGSCLGVLEIITSSIYDDYAFEVREVSRALKEENLKCPNVFENPSFYVGDERRKYEEEKIFCALKIICDVHNIPLAQTWGHSGYSSVVVTNSGNLERSCSSFNRSCIGKVCMSTSDLPFYIRDKSMWGFHEVSKERHLNKSQGVVGQSLSSCGLCFCDDITKLGVNEYSLVHHARMNGITSCLAIYLKSIERGVEYVIELILPPHNANGAGLQSLVKTVKQQTKNSFQLGNMSDLQFIGGVPLNWNIESPPSSITLLTEGGEIQAESNEFPIVKHIGNIMKNQPSNSTAAETGPSVVSGLDVGIEDLDIDQGKRKRTETSVALENSKGLYGRKAMKELASIFTDGHRENGSPTTRMRWGSLVVPVYVILNGELVLLGVLELVSTTVSYERDLNEVYKEPESVSLLPSTGIDSLSTVHSSSLGCYFHLAPPVGQSSGVAPNKLELDKDTLEIFEYPGIPSTDILASFAPETQLNQTLYVPSYFGSLGDGPISSRNEGISELPRKQCIAFFSETRINQTVYETNAIADDFSYYWDGGVSEMSLDLMMPANAALETQINQIASNTSNIEALVEFERAHPNSMPERDETENQGEFGNTDQNMDVFFNFEEWENIFID